jgi:hypothetical protein
MVSREGDQQRAATFGSGPCGRVWHLWIRVWEGVAFVDRVWEGVAPVKQDL